MAERIGDVEQKILLGIGSAAAAAAIFAPVSYKAKGVLTGIAASAIINGIYGRASVKRLLGF
jgi:hypothetical protein